MDLNLVGMNYACAVQYLGKAHSDFYTTLPSLPLPFAASMIYFLKFLNFPIYSLLYLSFVLTLSNDS